MSFYLKLTTGVGALVLLLAWLNAHPYQADPFPNRPAHQTAERHDDLVSWNGWW
jgi:hypothetical protein